MLCSAVLQEGEAKMKHKPIMDPFPNAPTGMRSFAQVEMHLKVYGTLPGEECGIDECNCTPLVQDDFTGPCNGGACKFLERAGWKCSDCYEARAK